FKLGRINATGGSLRIAMEGPEPVGLEASILNGRLGQIGEGGIEVTGAVRAEAKLKPGFGLVLKTRGTPTLKDLINIIYGPYMNAGGAKNPLKVLHAGLDKLPNPKLPLSQQADIIITPTGFVVEDFNYPDPQIFVNAKAAEAGITLILESDIKADPGKFLKGDIAGALPKGYVKFTENNDDFNNGIKKVAGKVPFGDKAISFIMDKGFTFHAVTATVNIDGATSAGKGSVVYRLAGTERSLDDIPIEGIFDPALLAEYVLDRLAKILMNPPEWVKSIPGATQALKAAGFAVKEAAVLAGDVGSMAKDLVTDPKALGKDAIKLGEDVGKGAIAVGSAAIDLGSKALASVGSIFSGSRDTSQDALHKNIPPFKKEQALSIMCSLEGGRCAFGGKRLVAYGAAGSFIFKENVSGGMDCTNANFGGQDPLPGSTKACYYPALLPAPSSKCGDENGKCTINAGSQPQDIYYGLGTMFAIKHCVTNTVDCSNSSFGADPTYGGGKSCYTQKSDCDPHKLFNFKCAREHGRCSFEGTKDVAYGRDGVWTIKQGVSGGITCDTNTFGGRDPVPGGKYCYIQAPELTPPQASEKCADENGACTISGVLLGKEFRAKTVPQDIFFGADGGYAVKKCVGSGTIPCKSDTFGGDPAVGAGKACYWRNSACAK
ncbi:MAG: hypothetical protein HXX19_18430, partial [Rhodoferax sp.]|nr:hypothetical protein [Rhodoferax sp.]